MKGLAFLAVFLLTIAHARAAEETYLGYLSYEGGFEPVVSLPVSVTKNIQYLRFSQGSSCWGTEFISVATRKNGKLVKASLIDPERLLYKVSDPAAGKTTEVVLTLDSNQALINCNIAVYATLQMLPPPPVGSVHDITVRNDSNYDARVAIAYKRNGEWLTYGWKKVYAGTSAAVLNKVPGYEVYGYAYTSNAGAWPAQGDKTFCVNKSLAGEISSAPCLSGNPGYEWRSFRKFHFFEPIGPHIWTLTNR